MQPPESIYLNPGELSINAAPALVTTVLGSCVAITLFSPNVGLGAVCHAMLPLGGSEQSFRYVDHALHYMLQSFYQAGVRLKELEVKLFGGAEMFEPNGSGWRRPSIGRQNIETALTLLSDEGLELSASCLGGNQGRKLLFYAHTGEVQIRKVPKSLPTAATAAPHLQRSNLRNLALGI